MGPCPPRLPDGEPAPADGALPPMRSRAVGARPFGIYVHVPFCASRCGYCDFNTYTATELGGGGCAARSTPTSRSPSSTSRARCSATPTSRCSTVFFGGGTPTLLPADELVRSGAPRSATRSGSRPTPRSRPRPTRSPSTRRRSRRCARPASPASRSACSRAAEHVLAAARPSAHARAACASAVAEARAAGFEHVNLDLIYGTPGETDDDWRRSLDAALATGAGPRVGVRADRRGRALGWRRRSAAASCRCPTTTSLADRYLMADETLSRSRLRLVRGLATGRVAGRRSAGTTCSTGAAPTGGASAPARTATSAACAGGTSSTRLPTPAGWPTAPRPAQARELLDAETRRVEQVMLELRLRDGLPLDVLDAAGRAAATGCSRTVSSTFATTGLC